MLSMHILAAIAGLAIVLVILGDAFEAIVLPRRITRRFRFTRLFFRHTWIPWRRLVGGLRHRRRRETLLGFYGPLSLIFLFLSWAALLIMGFALLQWAGGTQLRGEPNSGFLTDLYFSGTTFTTLGIGDLTPVSGLARLLAVWEAGTGFGFLAIIIGYLPVIYQAFSRREANISLLDARGGSPPAALEILRRYAEAGAFREIHGLLHDFERWSAELLESHISYPVLTLFRSQHNNESWLAALTTMLDLSALIIAGVEGIERYQAQLTFAMARHAAVDLAQILGTPPTAPVPDRLAPPQFALMRERLSDYGIPLRHPPVVAAGQLRELRRQYEPYVYALSAYLELDLPGWFAREDVPDNWQTSAWERAAQRLSSPPPAVGDDHS